MPPLRCRHKDSFNLRLRFAKSLFFSVKSQGWLLKPEFSLVHSLILINFGSCLVGLYNPIWSRGTPKFSILIRFPLINNPYNPFWGTPNLGNPYKPYLNQPVWPQISGFLSAEVPSLVAFGSFGVLEASTTCCRCVGVPGSSQVTGGSSRWKLWF